MIICYQDVQASTETTTDTIASNYDTSQAHTTQFRLGAQQEHIFHLCYHLAKETAVSFGGDRILVLDEVNTARKWSPCPSTCRRSPAL